MNQYFERLQKLKEEAEKGYELHRIEMMLRNLPVEKFFFKPPPAPLYRLFVRTYLSFFSFSKFIKIKQNSLQVVKK